MSKFPVLFSLVFLGLLPFLSQGQNVHLDSLKLSLKREMPDTSRISVLLDMGYQLGYSDGKQARKYLAEAYQLAKKQQLTLKMGEAMCYVGQSYYQSDDFDSAQYYYQLADRLFKKVHTEEGRMDLVVNRMSLATVAMTQGKSSVAIHYYLQTIDSLQQTNLPGKWTNLVTVYTNIGLVYNDLKQYDKALHYHQKAFMVGQKKGELPLKMALVKLNIAHDYINLKQFDKASIYLQKGAADAEKLQSADLFAVLYGFKGKYFKGINKPQSAIEADLLSFKYARLAGNKFQQENMLGQIGYIYQGEKKYSKSIPYLEKALIASRAIGDKIREVSYLKNLSSIHALLHHDQQAVKYYQAFIKLSDSLNEQETKKKINEIENKYQAEKKQVRILALQKDNQLQQLELRHKNLLNVALAAGFALLLLIAALLYFNFKNKNRLFRQKEALHKQRILELEKERQLAAAESLLKGQETERGRLARDLHDGVGGLLSGVKLSLSTMKGNVFLSEENAQAFNNVVWQLDQSIAELRRVSHNMMPEALIKYGLKEALENYCESLNLSGKMNVKLQIYGLEQRLEQNTEIVLYRIVQELLNNVIRHAEAKSILVQFMRESHRVSLTVEDDGRGFDVIEAAKKDGAGLANVRARAGYLGATVDVRSVPGEGTSVHIEGEFD